MVSLVAFYPLNAVAWRLIWSSDLTDPTFYLYRDGLLFLTTALTETTVDIPPGTSPVFEVLDSSSDTPTPAYPSTVLLTWLAVAGAASYNVDQEIASVWSNLAGIADDGSAVFDWQSDPQPDGQTATFRVVPVGANGNAGTPLVSNKLVVRIPDPPNVSAVYTPGPDYATQALARSPLAYYRFGESSGPAVNLGTGGSADNGTYAGGITLLNPGAIADDANASALSDGSGYVTTPTPMPSTGTFLLWIYPTSYASVGSFMGPGFLNLTPAGLLACDGSATGSHTSTFAVPLNAWTQIGIQWTAGTVNLIANGNVVLSFSDTIYILTPPFNDLYIGGRPDVSGNPNYSLNGAFDEAQLYASFLTAPQLLADNDAGIAQKRRVQLSAV